MQIVIAMVIQRHSKTLKPHNQQSTTHTAHYARPSDEPKAHSDETRVASSQCSSSHDTTSSTWRALHSIRTRILLLQLTLPTTLRRRKAAQNTAREKHPLKTRVGLSKFEGVDTSKSYHPIAVSKIAAVMLPCDVTHAFRGARAPRFSNTHT